MENELAKEWIPHSYQMRAINHLLDIGSGQLYLDPGRGKTATCLATYMEIRKFDPRPALVIAPLRPTYLVWPLEIHKWKQFNGLKSIVLHGPDKDKNYDKDADLYVLNYDGLKWFSSKMERKKKEFSVIMLDEITYVKDSSTQRFKFLSSFIKGIPRRWGLTGTPASNSLMDVFTPQLLVDRGATFGRFFTNFRSSYFEQGYADYQWNLKPGAEERIYDKLSVSCLRIEEEDLISLPELIVNDVFIDLNPESKKLYKDLENQLFIEMEEGVVTAVNAAVGVMKLQQIANGGIYLDSVSPDEERVTQHLHNAKVEAAREIVEDLGGRGALIVYHFKHDLERLKEEFPNAPVIGSGTSQHRTAEIVDEWNAGRHEVVLAHYQSMSHGLNLQEFGEAIIWCSLTYSRESYDQLIARIHRQGNNRKHVVVHRIIARDTVDEDIIRILETKGATQGALLDGIKQRQMDHRA